MGRVIKPAGQDATEAKHERYQLSIHGDRGERRLLSIGGLGPFLRHGKPTPKNPGRGKK